jgi:hypothetical protein
LSRVFSHAELLAQPPCNSRASARFDRAESSCARGASNRIFAGLCVVERSSRGNAPLLGVPWPTFSRNASIDSAQRSRRAAETLARGSAMVSARALRISTSNGPRPPSRVPIFSVTEERPRPIGCGKKRDRPCNGSGPYGCPEALSAHGSVTYEVQSGENPCRSKHEKNNGRNV